VNALGNVAVQMSLNTLQVASYYSPQNRRFMCLALILSTCIFQ